MKPAIIISGHTMALGVVRALGAMGVPIVLLHYDERDMAHLSKYVTIHIKTPHPEHDETRFIDLLIDNARHFGEGLVMPVSDESLTAISRNKHLLESYYRVACTEWEITRRFIDKKETCQIAEKQGIPSPRTFFPESEKEVVAYASGIDFPYLVKPCQSHLFFEHFKRKMVPATSVEHMLEIYRQAFSMGLEVMLQEIVRGDDTHVVNYNAYVWGGRALVEFTAEHVRNAPPSFGSPRVAVSRSIPEVIESGRSILRAMGFYGYACTEFKKDPQSGTFKLMEVNGRHNLSTLLAVHCGINFPWLHYRHLMLGELPEHARFRKEVYWIDVYRDVAYCAISLKKERYSPKQYIRPYIKPHVFAIFDWGDIKPFFQRTCFLVSKLVQYIFSSMRWRKRRKSDRDRKPHTRSGRIFSVKS